jgi:IS5 family transposase
MSRNLRILGHFEFCSMPNLLLFSNQQLLHQRFLLTDLGRLYLSIPFDDLASTIALPDHHKKGLGRKPWFDVKGGIGLLVLKSYLQISDELLIERINTDWAMQLFCGILLHPGQQIRDTNLPGMWRGYIGRHLDIAMMQQKLASHWKPYLQHSGIGMQDATCYESRISFPTDIKLLWQSCQYVYRLIQDLRHHKKLRRSRMNFDKHNLAVLSYQKTKKKTRRQEKKLRKKVVKFLLNLITHLRELQQNAGVRLSDKQQQQLKTIIKIYEQQHGKLYGDSTVIKDRIVSLSKPYIRPIVRGKEVKLVEFGAKVNMLQIDGINFIEHLSYDAFNEGTRLQSGIYLQRKLMGKCTHQSADKIYATNANRKYCSAQNIVTNFLPKGKQKLQHIAQAEILRRSLDRARGTRLEGSFGNEKNHYLLSKIAARNQTTETCWIFFGIMTANASKITNRMQRQKSEAHQRAA